MTFRKSINNVSKLLPAKPNITSPSFRIGYISQLWKDTKDIEFVLNSNSYWKGSILRFKGNQAQCFYKDLKFQKVNWSIFDFENTNLGRVDLS